jgi:hypothetical protein
MKTHRYTYLVVFTIVGCLLFSADTFGQRGRPHRGGGYYRPNYHSYGRTHYSYRSYAYNRPFISLSFGGNPYRYQQGYFYRPYGSMFRVSAPPFGISITTLPVGYRRVYAGPDPYYYYNGIYYRSAPNSQYQVVAPPLGALVTELPPGAQVTVIDGRKYYEADGTYYEETINAQNELEYTVVGTDGVLNTTGDIEDAPVPAGPQMGDRFDSLPVDAKAVVIRGEKLYTSASGIYYKEVLDGNKVYYEVVGK